MRPRFRKKNFSALRKVVQVIADYVETDWIRGIRAECGMVLANSRAMRPFAEIVGNAAHLSTMVFPTIETELVGNVKVSSGL